MVSEHVCYTRRNAHHAKAMPRRRWPRPSYRAGCETVKIFGFFAYLDKATADCSPISGTALIEHEGDATVVRPPGRSAPPTVPSGAARSPSLRRTPAPGRVRRAKRADARKTVALILPEAARRSSRSSKRLPRPPPGAYRFLNYKARISKNTPRKALDRSTCCRPRKKDIVPPRKA